MKAESNSVRLGIVDHQQLFVDLARAWFESSGEFTVVLSAVFAVAALELLNGERKIDVCIVDVMPPTGDGVDLVSKVAKMNDGPRVVACANIQDSATVQRSIQAGARGFVSKDMSLDQLSDAVRTVAAGNVYLSLEELEKVVGRGGRQVEPHERLGRREFEVFMCIARGLSTKEIAERLFLDQRTVSTYKRHVLDKMKFERVSELVTYALRRGLLD